jgi:hypothetical protein
MSWGKGWEVGVRKAIWQHQTVRRMAAEILAAEHGQHHEAGSRTDLCPLCQGRCPDCDGTGQVGLQRDGQPIECARCRGKGEVRV